MNDRIVLEEIRVAKNGVTAAQSDLARLVNEIEAAPRPAKTPISEALHNAFQKLRDGREYLVKLETLIQTKDD